MALEVCTILIYGAFFKSTRLFIQKPLVLFKKQNF